MEGGGDYSGRKHINGGLPGEQKELRRPHNSGIANSSTSGGSLIGRPSERPLNLGAQSNSMPFSLPSEMPQFGQPASRTENYGFIISSEAVNVPSGPTPTKSTAFLDPRFSETVKNSKLSPLAKEFVPRAAPTEEPSTNQDNSSYEYMFCMVNEFIEEVTMNPGKFDEEVILLTETLNVMVKTKEYTNALIDIILRQAILEPNFRYNGARLCKHLIQHLGGHDSQSSKHGFKYLLLEKCQSEYEQRETLLKTNQAYLRGLVFFFGEIYSQILQDSGRINIFRLAIISLMDSLLQEPTGDNLKCVCQVLKMTGANQEDDERELTDQDDYNLDRIFDRLKVITPPPEFQSMVSNVIQLRSINWGRLSSIPAESPSPAHIMAGGAVFYGPDGQPMSNEEALFLESQSYYDYRLDTYDEDFNDEIAADYESFLREMGQ